MSLPVENSHRSIASRTGEQIGWSSVLPYKEYVAIAMYIWMFVKNLQQVEWNEGISFALSLVCPFGVYLLTGHDWIIFTKLISKTHPVFGVLRFQIKNICLTFCCYGNKHNWSKNRYFYLTEWENIRGYPSSPLKKSSLSGRILIEIGFEIGFVHKDVQGKWEG